MSENDDSPRLKLTRRFIVTGRVQGVFFRDSTRRVAESLSLVGHAINCSDGSVEVVACGTAEALDSLYEWLHDGPPLASVTAVTERECDSGDDDFRDSFRTG